MNHAYLAPSSFDLAEKCNASVSRQHFIASRQQLLCEAGAEFYGLSGDDESRYKGYFIDPYKESQDNGTGLHEIFELGILGKWSEDEIVNAIQNHKLLSYSAKSNLMIEQKMTAIIAQKIKDAERADWFDVEHRVKVRGLPQFGTADWVSVIDRTAYVEDLKTGRNEVYADSSSQIMCYGVALLDEWGWDKIDTVCLSIIGVQFPSSTIEISSDELMEFKRTRMLKTFMGAYDINPVAKAGKHCTFCKAKVHCKEWLDKYSKANDKAMTAKFEDLSNDDLVELYQMLSQSKEATNNLKTILLEKLESFNPPIGVKRVGGGKRSSWKDPEAVEKQLGKKVDLYKPKSIRPVSEVKLLCEQNDIEFDMDELADTVTSGVYLKLTS